MVIVAADRNRLVQKLDRYKMKNEQFNRFMLIKEAAIKIMFACFFESKKLSRYLKQRKTLSWNRS